MSVSNNTDNSNLNMADFQPTTSSSSSSSSTSSSSSSLGSSRTIQDMPGEILQNIFSFIPAQQRTPVALVDHQWNANFNDLRNHEDAQKAKKHPLFKEIAKNESDPIKAIKNTLKEIQFQTDLSLIFLAEHLNIEALNTFLETKEDLEPKEYAQAIRNWMKENTEELAKIKVLDLQGEGIKILPAEISYLTNLEKLDLSNNDMQVFPDQLAKLDKLQWLNLNDNNLTEFPEVLTKIPNLKVLSLNHNQLKVIPNTIGNLTQLDTLLVDANQLKTLPKELKEFHNICISMNNNPIESFPDEFFSDNGKAMFLSANFSNFRLPEQAELLESLVKGNLMSDNLINLR